MQCISVDVELISFGPKKVHFIILLESANAWEMEPAIIKVNYGVRRWCLARTQITSSPIGLTILIIESQVPRLGPQGVPVPDQVRYIPADSCGLGRLQHRAHGNPLHGEVFVAIRSWPQWPPVVLRTVILSGNVSAAV